jgi:hypothetical protein
MLKGEPLSYLDGRYLDERRLQKISSTKLKLDGILLKKAAAFFGLKSLLFGFLRALREPCNGLSWEDTTPLMDKTSQAQD